MNILVTGANGQLGQEMQLASKNTKDNYIFTDITGGYPELDITDAEAVYRFVSEHDIKTIINCAAYTNVDAAETDTAVCDILNAVAPAILAEAMCEADGLLVHISSDYVFGADPYNTPCTETQTGTPTGVYGATKLQGERNIIASGARHLIIRTSWLYSEYGRNFVKTMLALTAEKPSLNVVFDQVGTPTYAFDLAEAIFNIVENRKYEGRDGIYHYSNEGVASWFDFTKQIASIAGHTSCAIHPCHSNEFPSPVTRPPFSVLDKTKFKTTFGISIPYWVDSLKVCLGNLLSSK